jgi:hypothetical protein
MIVHSIEAWKLALALPLAGAILLSLIARPPRFTVPGGQLRRLVMGAVTLYLLGAYTRFTHHTVTSAAVFAAGISLSALAAWLSRGRTPEDPRREPVDPEPPAAPRDEPRFDWPAFERDFQSYSRRPREPAGRN